MSKKNNQRRMSVLFAAILMCALAITAIPVTAMAEEGNTNVTQDKSEDKLPTHNLILDEKTLGSLDYTYEEGDLVIIHSTKSKVIDIIARDANGNQIKVDLRIPWGRYADEPTNTYVQDWYMIHMPTSDVYVTPVLKDRYSITMEPSVPEGLFTTNVNQSYVNGAVIITVNNTMGYKYNDILVMDDEYNLVDLEKLDDTHYKFVMPYSDITIGADIYGYEPDENTTDSESNKVSDASLTNTSRADNNSVRTKNNTNNTNKTITPPKTGDNSLLIICIALFALLGATSTGIIVIRRKK